MGGLLAMTKYILSNYNSCTHKLVRSAAYLMFEYVSEAKTHKTNANICVSQVAQTKLKKWSFVCVK